MDSRILKIILVALLTFLLLMTVVVNYLSSSQLGRDSGLFENKNNSYLPWNQRGNIKDTGLTPPGWAFIIWGVIYVYQAAMLAYIWSLLFRTDDKGAYLCNIPGLLPTAALALHSVTSVFNIAWVFLADRIDSNNAMLVPQTIVIVLLAVAMAVAVGISYHGLLKAQADGLPKRELLLSIGLWLNSNGLYLGWVTVASFLNVAIAIINVSNWPVNQSDNLSLMHVIVILTVYAVLDLTYLRLHFLYSPYITAIWALVTSVINNFGAQSALSVISIEAAIALVFVLAAKIYLAVRDCRSRSVQPLPKVADDHSSSSAAANVSNSKAALA